MKRLNLLPKDIRYGPLYRVFLFAKAHLVRVACWGIMLFLTVTIGTNIAQSVLIRKYTVELRQEKKALDTARAKGKSIEELSLQYKKMFAYLNYVNNLVQRQIDQLEWRKKNWGSWGLTLAELKRYIPKRLWLYSLETKEGVLSIEGGSFSEDSITAFMSNLRGSLSFSGVQFDYTNKVAIAAAEVMNFKINCKYDTKAAVR